MPAVDLQLPLQHSTVAALASNTPCRARAVEIEMSFVSEHSVDLDVPLSVAFDKLGKGQGLEAAARLSDLCEVSLKSLCVTQLCSCSYPVLRIHRKGSSSHQWISIRRSYSPDGSFSAISIRRRAPSSPSALYPRRIRSSALWTLYQAHQARRQHGMGGRSEYGPIRIAHGRRDQDPEDQDVSSAVREEDESN
jgi:hypothetical protein